MHLKRCWRRMLEMKWTYRITNYEVFQRGEEKRLLLNILKNRHHSWIRHTVRHNEFVVNVLEGAIFGKQGSGKTSTTILKANRQKHRSWSYSAMKRMACNNSRWKAANRSKE